jgi:hypothetical protein
VYLNAQIEIVIFIEINELLFLKTRGRKLLFYLHPLKMEKLNFSWVKVEIAHYRPG